MKDIASVSRGTCTYKRKLLLSGSVRLWGVRRAFGGSCRIAADACPTPDNDAQVTNPRRPRRRRNAAPPVGLIKDCNESLSSCRQLFLAIAVIHANALAVDRKWYLSAPKTPRRALKRFRRTCLKSLRYTINCNLISCFCIRSFKLRCYSCSKISGKKTILSKILPSQSF